MNEQFMNDKAVIRVDFHVHSDYSADSSTDIKKIPSALQERGVSKVAITDHNEIKGALNLREKFPDLVIVGEEILTQSGEITAFFLEKKIKAHLELEEAVFQAKNQGAIIGIPHPFDFFRKGLGAKNMQRILDEIDVIEVFNGKTFLNYKNERALDFARENELLMVAGSDAHHHTEIGRSYVELESFSGPADLLRKLKKGHIHRDRQKLISVIKNLYTGAKNKIIHGRSVRK